MKERKMWWAEHVTRMREKCQKFLMGKPNEEDHLEDYGIGVTLILIWIFKSWDGETWTGRI
jgi:hypothetical protein